MRMTEIDFGAQIPVDGYGPGFFRIGGHVMSGDLLILPTGPEPWDGSWDAVFAAKDAFDVLFIGMGEEIAPLGAEDSDALKAAGVAHDVMATAAACRTYNVLLSEGRRVAAALRAV